jgi:predicted dehydrogenase
MEKKIKKEKSISRRGFIQSSVKGAIGLSLLPTILPSCSNYKGANDRVRIGHIGVGSRGTWELMYYFLPEKGALNIAVCDVYKDRRDQAALAIEKFYKENNTPEKCATYPDFEELLQSKNIDAVHITTPDHWHVNIAIKAARAGKHIMLAKPLGLSYQEYVELKKVTSEKDIRFHYGTQQRTSDHMRLGYNMIREGQIGEIIKADVWAPGKGDGLTSPVCNEVPVPEGFDFDKWTGPAPMKPYCPERVTNNGSWFNYDYSIGFLGGWGAHPLDILTWILRDKISGTYSSEGTGQFWPAGGLYDNICSWDVSCKYQNGFELHFVSTDVAAKGVLDHRLLKEDNGTTFYGTKGWISLSRSSAQSDIPEIDKQLNNFPKNKNGWINGENNRMGNVFVDIIRGKSKELCPLDEAIISDSISHMGDITIRINRKITWDPIKGEVLNDPEANKLYFRERRRPYNVL